MPIVFYLPPATDQERIDFILSHGGQVSNIVECFTHQISMISSKAGASFEPGFTKKQPNPKMYFPGKIYSFDWVLDCIKGGRADLPISDQYLLMQIPYPHALTQTNASLKKQSGLSGQRTRFTMRELIKIFQVTFEFPSKKNKN